MKSSIKFSFSGYKSLLKTILKKREIVNFENYKYQKALFLILRHDIEYFTDIALKLGKIENSLGVKSTFFFLLTSTYNIFSEKNLEIVNKLKQMGHSFGIHYDSYLLKKYKLDFNRNLKQQIKIFENFFNVKIKVISSHRPKLDFETFREKKILNVYDKNFQKKIKYISDSQQVFRSNLYDLLSKNLNLHLLIHDYTWSKLDAKWEKNILTSLDNEYYYDKKYFLKVILQWKRGLKNRKKMDKIFKNKFLS
jgi:hypothetical protein